MKPLRVLVPAVLLLLACNPMIAALTPPRPIESPSPGYPAELEDSGVSGRAIVNLTITVNGDVENPVLKSADHAAFGAAAMAVIDRWKFEPAQRDGQPVAIKVDLPLVFDAPVGQQINHLLKRKVFRDVPEKPMNVKEYGTRPKPTKPGRMIYPKTLAGSGVTASVTVRFVVAPDGTTLNPDPQGDVRPEFLLPAIMAIATTGYEPLMKDGKPVYLELTTKLEFAEPKPGEAGKASGKDGAKKRAEGG